MTELGFDVAVDELTVKLLTILMVELKTVLSISLDALPYHRESKIYFWN